MKPARRDVDRMRDILEAIAGIHRHQPDSYDAFHADEVIRLFTLKQVEIVGEAVFKMSVELKSAHPDVPWRAIEKTRHAFVHDYFEIEWEKVWRIVTDHLEPLRVQIERIVEERKLAAE